MRLKEKFADSSREKVIEFFLLHNSSNRTVTLVFNQPLTEMSLKKFS
jgi:hypothetical protein